MTTCPYVDSNYAILLQDFYCRLSKSDPNKSYDIWVHGLGMTKVYFQIGMIIGDTEEHNKICGLRGGNGLYRRYVCRDCLVSKLKMLIIPILDVKVVKCQTLKSF